jgi:hypothetical protein
MTLITLYLDVPDRIHKKWHSIEVIFHEDYEVINPKEITLFKLTQVARSVQIRRCFIIIHKNGHYFPAPKSYTVDKLVQEITFAATKLSKKLLLNHNNRFYYDVLKEYFNARDKDMD